MRLPKEALFCLTLPLLSSCWFGKAISWAAQQLNPTSYSTVMPHVHEPTTRHKETLKQLVSVLDKPNSKVILVGASGVGKTTLLHALAGQAGALGGKKIVLIQTDRIRQLAPTGSSENTHAWLLRKAMNYWAAKFQGQVVFAIDDVHYVLHPNKKQHAFLFTALHSPARMVITTTDTAYSTLLQLQINRVADKPRRLVLR